MTDPVEPLNGKLVDALSEAELASTWARVEASRDAKVLRRARVRTARAAIGAAALVLVLIGLWPRPTGELLTRDGATVSQIEGGQRVELADDSLILTNPEGRLEVLENSPAQLALHLSHGGARFEVTPGTGRHWRVETGEVSVEVVGTVFSVTRQGSTVHVTVERGVVVVRGVGVPGGVRRLVAGERLETSPLEAGLAPSVAPAPSPVRRSEAAVVVAQPRPANRLLPLSVSQTSDANGQEAPLETAASLLATADLARREGKRDEAVTTLSALVARWPESAEAPLAAFTIANLLAESGRGEVASDWYRRALELKVEEPLAGAARRALDGGPR
jgi:transmembrane sensor